MDCRDRVAGLNTATHPIIVAFFPLTRDQSAAIAGSRSLPPTSGSAVECGRDRCWSSAASVSRAWITRLLSRIAGRPLSRATFASRHERRCLLPRYPTHSGESFYPGVESARIGWAIPMRLPSLSKKNVPSSPVPLLG